MIHMNGRDAESQKKNGQLCGSIYIYLAQIGNIGQQDYCAEVKSEHTPASKVCEMESAARADLEVKLPQR